MRSTAAAGSQKHPRGQRFRCACSFVLAYHSQLEVLWPTGALKHLGDIFCPQRTSLIRFFDSKRTRLVWMVENPKERSNKF